MKITVTEVSQTLKEILWETDFKKLKISAEDLDSTLSIQNLWTKDVYIEMKNIGPATVASWYKLFVNWEKEFSYKNIQNVQLISNLWDNLDIRLLNT